MTYVYVVVGLTVTLSGPAGLVLIVRHELAHRRTRRQLAEAHRPRAKLGG